MIEQAVDRATYRAVLGVPAFLAVFTVRSLSIVAETLRVLALSVLVLSETGSPALAAFAYGAGFLPQAVGGVLLGALPDLVPPRVLMTIGYLLEAAAAATLAVAGLPAWACLLVVASVATITPAFNGSAGRVVAQVLTGEHYVLGRSLLMVSASLAQLAGLAAGAAAVGLLGPRHTLIACAAVHLVAVLVTWLTVPTRRMPARTGVPLMRRGWQTTGRLLADRPLRILLLAMWLPPAMVTGAEGLLVGYAPTIGLAPSGVGLLLAAVLVGLLVGDVVMARLVRPAPRARLVAPLVALLGLPLLGFAASVGPVLACGLLLLAGCGFGYSVELQRRFVEAVPERTRGQGFALMSTGMMTAQGLGPLLFGMLSAFVPVGTAIATAGVCAMAMAAWLATHGFPTGAGSCGAARNAPS